jgi:hypothetical protein
MAAGGEQRELKAELATTETPNGRVWILGLVDIFGLRLILLLFAAQHLTKGFTNSFVAAAERFVYQELSLDAARMQVLMGVSTIPWALKPVFGLVSDTFPIMGFCKAPYMVLATIVGLAGLLVLSTQQSSLSANGVAISLFLFNIYIAFVDLLSEAVYARRLRSSPSLGPDLISFVWGGMTVAGLVAMVSSGALLVKSGPWAIYAVAIPAAAVVLVPVGLGWIDEPRLSKEEVAERRRGIFEQAETAVLCAVMLASTATLTLSGLFVEERRGLFLISIGILLVVLTAYSVLLTPMIAKVNAFVLIQCCLNLRLGAASFYFMIDDEEQFPEGPHFEKWFVSSVLPIIGSLCSLFGIYTYNRFGRNMTFRDIFVVGNLIVFFAQSVDVLFYLRWNVAWGISDRVFVLGTSAFESVIAAWLWMPGIVILSQLCPRDMEAIMYALLAGCYNLGGCISANLGGFALIYFDVQPTGARAESAAFADLWKVSLLGAALPLLSLVLVPYFIPAVRQTEQLAPPNATATAGSLWRRFRGNHKNTEDALITVELSEGQNAGRNQTQ